MKVLSIESSCDETGAAVVEKKGNTIKVLSNIIATSSEMHAKTGGIIPENAAREQVKSIIPVIVESLVEAENKNSKNFTDNFILASKILKGIDAIAVTYGPGLIGSLLIGVETAKTLSFTSKKPIIPVNHLLAHLYANFIASTDNKNPINFPFIGLIVSGGHTDLLYFKSHNDFKWLGGTRDDAAGEAIDKIGRMLDLPYPAGPEMEIRANRVKDINMKFQSPLINSNDFDFSFSGLKTEAMRYIKENKIDNDLTNKICYATQNAIFDVLIKKTLKAAEIYDCKSILLGGGVSANKTLLERFQSEIKNLKIKTEIFTPEKKYATDNAAMIGAYALINGEKKEWREVGSNPELYFS